MKIKDLKQGDIVPGLRIKGQKTPGLEGTILFTNHEDDEFSWVIWDNLDYAKSGFYGTNSNCEVVLDIDGNPVVKVLDSRELKEQQQLQKRYQERYK